jgi:20S proteasome alpha/beta subunit
MGPDFRVIVRKGQKAAQKYYLQYGVRQRRGGREGMGMGGHTHGRAPECRRRLSLRRQRSHPRRAAAFRAPRSPSAPQHSPRVRRPLTPLASASPPPPLPLYSPHLPLQESIPVLQLVREVAAIAQEFTQSGGVRPFGISILVAGVDDDGPQLFQIDPSGAYFGWRASAIGKNFSNAKTFLEKRYAEDMELEDAIHTALLTLREGFEGEMDSSNIEIGVVGADRKFRLLSKEEIADYLAEAE